MVVVDGNVQQIRQHLLCLGDRATQHGAPGVALFEPRVLLSGAISLRTMLIRPARCWPPIADIWTS